MQSNMLGKIKQHPFFAEMTPRLLHVTIVASLGACSAGYDAGWWSTFMASSEAIQDYGNIEVDGVKAFSSSYTSAGTGLGSAGLMLGCILFTPVAEKFGRKWCIFASAVASAIGVILESAIQNSFWGLTVGRIINGFGCGIANAIVPVYLSECAPSTIRGSLVSFYQWFYTFGQFFAYVILYGTRNYTNKWQYLTVIVFQVLFPVSMMVSTVFLVESPRWLVQMDRVEEAKTALSSLYGPNTPHNIDEEIDNIKTAIDLLTSYRKDTSYIDLFKGVNLRRTLLALAVPCLLNGQGNAFMGSYLVLFMTQIGIPNTHMIMMVIMAVLLVTNSFSFWGTDRLGRRPLLMSSSAIMFAAFYCVAGISYYGNGSARDNNAVVGMLFIWCIFYGATWAQLQHVVASEIPSSQLREKTLSICTFFSSGIGMMISFVNPYIQNEGYGNLQGRVGFIYGSFSILAIIYTYFFIPELKNLPLEVVDTLFEAKAPTLKFHKMGLDLMENNKYLELDAVLSHRSVRLDSGAGSVEAERIIIDEKV